MRPASPTRELCSSERNVYRIPIVISIVGTHLATGVAHSCSKAMGSYFPSSNGIYLCRCACSRHFVIGVTFRADRPRVAFGHSGSCCTENPKVLHPCLMLWQAEMKLFAQRNSPLHGPRLLLEWNRWFAWYPVPFVIDGNLHYAWLQTVERKWGSSRYSGTIKWRYRLPTQSRWR